MKVAILKPTEIDLARLELDLPFYDDDEVPETFPGVDSVEERIKFAIELDAFKVENWPAGLTCNLYLKVRDSGVYRLIDRDGNTVKKIEDYVPQFIPGEYGDYIDLNIATDGTVTNMKPDRDDLRNLARLIDGYEPGDE